MRMESDRMMERAEEVLGSAVRTGADSAEVFASFVNRFRISQRGRELDAVSVAEDGGFALRVFAGGKTGFSTSSGGLETPEAVGALVASAIASARLGDDPALPIPRQPTALPEVEGAFDPGLASRSPGEKRALVKSHVDAAFAFSPKVRAIRSVAYSETDVLTVLANSGGLRLCKRGTGCSVSAAVMASDGDQSETAHEWFGGRSFDALKDADVGQAAARQAVSMLGASPVRTGRYDVVFEPVAAAGLLEAYAHALGGQMVARGKSPLAGLLGKRVGSERFCLVDDPLLPGGLSSEPFDDEGVPRRRAVVIDRGILSSFLLDGKTAFLMGAASTGNASRGDYRNLPSAVPANFHLAPSGDVDPGNLLRRLHDGLLVVDLMGVHTIDPVSGGFSLGASGFVVEQGQVRRPFRGVTIAGSLYEVFHRLAAAGEDLRFFGEVGSPSLLIEGIDVAGDAG